MLCCETFTKVLRSFTGNFSAFFSFLCPTQLPCNKHLDFQDWQIWTGHKLCSSFLSKDSSPNWNVERKKKKRNDFVFLVFLFFICSALVAKRHSLQTIWAKGCLCLCRVLVTLKVQVVKKRKELLLLDFYRKTQMLSSSRDPKVEFQHRLYGLAVGGLCRGNGIWMDLAVRNEAVGHPWIWAWAAAKESGSGNPSRIPRCPQKC